MDEVTGRLENELVSLLLDHDVVDCDVLAGSNDAAPRPDEYLSVVAVEAEYRAGHAWLVEVEMRSVVAVDDLDATARQKARLRAVMDFFQRVDSPARGYASGTLLLHGYVPRRLFSKVGERSRAEIAHWRFGASAVGG